MSTKSKKKGKRKHGSSAELIDVEMDDASRPRSEHPQVPAHAPDQRATKSWKWIPLSSEENLSKGTIFSQDGS